MGKRDKYSVLPMSHVGDGFSCTIDSLETYHKVLSGDASIPKICHFVRIPKSVFISLTQSEENRLPALNYHIGDEIYWYNYEPNPADCESDSICGGIITGLHILDHSGRIFISIGPEGKEIIGSLGHNEDYESYLSLTYNDALESMSVYSINSPSTEGDGKWIIN